MLVTRGFINNTILTRGLNDAIFIQLKARFIRVASRIEKELTFISKIWK